MSMKFSSRGVKVLLVVAVLILGITVGGGIAFYKASYTKPENVFRAMLENSLRTQSVTKQISQNDETQTVDQKMRLQQGEKHVAEGDTSLVQTGISTAKVQTESMGTPWRDYVRYRSIETDQKREDGSDIDFSKVLGVWGVTEQSETTGGELYNELALGVIPSGNLSPASRASILKLIDDQNVYEVDYDKVTKKTQNGRTVYTYEVTVKPQPYIALLKTYAKAVGLTQLDDIDPEEYANADPLQFTVSVDVLTRRVKEVSYGSGRTEKYIAFGQHKNVDLPEDTISVSDLQSLIQEVQ